LERANLDWKEFFENDLQSEIGEKVREDFRLTFFLNAMVNMIKSCVMDDSRSTRELLGVSAAGKPIFTISMKGFYDNEATSLAEVSEGHIYASSGSTAESTEATLDGLSLAPGADVCEDCLCTAPRPTLATSIPWLPALRVDAGNTALLTISAVGVLCSLVFSAYLWCKACSEVVEGSQTLSVLVLLSFVVMYAACLPFAMVADKIVCFARLQGTAIAYSTLFSFMVARAIMLATSDVDGLPGHVSGVTQMALALALAVVQPALAIQEWFLRDEPYSRAFVDGQFQEGGCADHGFPFLVRLAWPAFLLSVLIIISPCIVSSKRNYSEGALFCLGSLACLGVWLGWTLPYFVLSPGHSEWFNFAVCCGLVGTPSILLLVIFVPKVSSLA